MLPRLQEVEDLQGDDLLYYDAEMELTNMILLSIPNEIYNSGNTRITNEFDQFVAEPGESLVSVYNHFAQLMNDLERNNMKFPTVSVNTKFLNSLQLEWLKYVTQVCLAKKLTVDSFDDLFVYLLQFEKLVNTSRAKKLEKSHDPLALVAHTGSSSRNTSSYYVTHPSSVVDYVEEYEQDDVHNHTEDPLASAMLNQAVVQGDRVNIQNRNSGNAGRNNRRAYVQGEVVEGLNATNETANGFHDSKYFMEQMLLAKKDEAGVILSDEQNDFLFADVSRMEEIEELTPKTRFSEKATQSKNLDTTSVASKSKIDNASASDKPLSPFMLNKIRTSSLWQKWFESQPNVKWTPVNTKPHDNTNPSNTKPLVSVVQIVLWVVNSGCSKHMTGDHSLLRNFIKKFMGTVRFRNDNFAAITGYGEYIHGNITIFHVYYVEGLGHNLFSVGQFCDGDLEVAFRSKTCYVRNLERDDLLTGGRDSNLYTISISDMAASSPICIMSKATLTKSWLWHRRLSHLNFGPINDLTKLNLVDGLPKFKYGKDHLCSACERGKTKKASHPPKLIPSDYSKLELLHMDLCGPMRVDSINGKKYIYNTSCFRSLYDIM
ncbi:retrovirus-related pol polyprotein from transposon TNT 1-94 [Tanacetum coccineum]|uniref:Retrovirus-related pol polyprotein from transposon TNT 1-94 n=1 Tax=Tanacetum coccineum TaxID=301880 RepID=A0ABQ4XA05_9ASTR